MTRAGIQSEDQAGALGSQSHRLLKTVELEKQVRQNLESQRLQYEVADRIRALGWKQVEIYR